MSTPLDSTEEKIVGVIEIGFSFFVAFMMAFLIAKELLVIQRRGGVVFLGQFMACTFYSLLALFLMLRAATKIDTHWIDRILEYQ
ncbi:hypothetical protein PRIPAC_78593 [Pristionchus pacificus]|uniref:Uncharacterized protein n=1 Tax=Pristionchus pacificus TaxID=54126 RepID=A0A2A6CB06_PRIPA|nr:hypothetical protein PRIPAC_78593 [Pristionchus pacificus]|eukprot:PDM75364.1 hypothetical protein PRIPAC_42541 [Pristionchus pacificus]